MEDQTPASPAHEEPRAEFTGNEPGAQAVEALVRAIAQEFVLAFDEFHDSLLADDEADDPPKVQAAGS